MTFMSKIITLEEIEILRKPLESLNKHHNNKSIYFSSSYPRVTFDERVKNYRANEKSGKYRIEVLTSSETETIIGFCIIYIKLDLGKIEVLYVDENCRRIGIGTKLINNAMKWFALNNIHEIELTVVYGNDDAISFYQKFGFYPRSYIMSNRC